VVVVVDGLDPTVRSDVDDNLTAVDRNPLEILDEADRVAKHSVVNTVVTQVG
jgi:hypothetical protein